MTENRSLHVGALAVVYAFLLCTLSVSGSISIYNATVLLYLLCTAYINGNFFNPLRRYLLGITEGLSSVLIGALLFSFFIFVSVKISLLLAFAGISAVACFWSMRKKVVLSVVLTRTEAVAILIAFLLAILISRPELRAEFLAYSPGYREGYDLNFFTSVLASIRRGTLNNAAYEAGSPVVYQDLGFFIPAMLANALKISSHQALWGLAQPLYKLLTILMGYEVLYYFFRERIARDNYGFLVLAMCFPLLLAPLHPLYLAKLDVHNFVFSGIGYLVPAGTITYPVSMGVLLLSFLAFSVSDWKGKDDKAMKTFFAISSGLLVIGKLPVFFVFFVAVWSMVLFRIVFWKARIMSYLPYLVVSLVVFCVCWKACLSFPSLSRMGIRYGYLTSYFANLYHRSNTGVGNQLLVFLLMVFTYLLWLGVRFVGLLGLVRVKASKYPDLLFGAIVAMVAASVVALYLRLGSYDVRGVLQRDYTFDVEQFVRSSFYVATVMGSIGLMNIILNAESARLRQVFSGISFFWCLVAALPLLSGAATAVHRQDSWYADNLGVLKSGKLNNGLIAVDPVSPTYGIMLSASDYGAYWTVMGLNKVGYNSVARNAYRWDMYADLMTRPTEALLDSFRADNVKYIISVPEDVATLDSLTTRFPQRVVKATYAKWIYELR